MIFYLLLEVSLMSHARLKLASLQYTPYLAPFQVGDSIPELMRQSDVKDLNLRSHASKASGIDQTSPTSVIYIIYFTIIMLVE